MGSWMEKFVSGINITDPLGRRCSVLLALIGTKINSATFGYTNANAVKPYAFQAVLTNFPYVVLEPVTSVVDPH
jgi:hypothetical protein